MLVKVAQRCAQRIEMPLTVGSDISSDFLEMMTLTHPEIDGEVLRVLEDGMYLVRLECGCEFPTSGEALEAP